MEHNDDSTPLHEATNPPDSTTEREGYAIPDRIAVDARGFTWRVWDDKDYWSMAPTTDDNEPIPEPITWFRKVSDDAPERGCAAVGGRDAEARNDHADAARGEGRSMGAQDVGERVAGTERPRWGTAEGNQQRAAKARIAVENVCADLLDHFHELNDDPDAIFGEYPEVGPRVWDGDAVSFTVSGNGESVRITIGPNE